MIGAQIGTYRMVRQIGEGGMGSVWLAEHVMLGRQVAIKVLHREMSLKPDLVARFFNEAKAATAISDPGIVQIFDFGQHLDGSAYIVMELLEGEALDKRLARMHRLSLGASLRISRQVAASLGAAHQRGIVHRDLKPENVFLVRDPEVAGGERTKLLDFGIAKMTIDKGVKTHTKAVMGTPTFMSPEQCRGAGQVDQRSDVYSLGCVLFTLLTGRPPFDADGPGEIIAMHLREPPPAPSSVLPGIPPAVDALILRCLAKDRAQRFESGAELAAAIERVLTDPLVQPFMAELPLGPGRRAVTSSDALAAAPRRELPPTAPPVALSAPAAAALPSAAPSGPPLRGGAADAGGLAPHMAVSARAEPVQSLEDQTTAAFVPVDGLDAALRSMTGSGTGPPLRPTTEGAVVAAPRAYSGAQLTTLSTSTAVAVGASRRKAARWWLGGAVLAFAGVAAAVVAARPTSELEAGGQVNAASAIDGGAAGSAVASPGVDAAVVASVDASVDAAAVAAVDTSVDAAVVASVDASVVAPIVAPVVAAAAVDAGAPGPGAEAQPDLQREARLAMNALLREFEKWSSAHAKDPCPSARTLSKSLSLSQELLANLKITCTEQPADHRLGVVWAGPDAKSETADDVRSWTVSSDEVPPVLGPRWGSSAAPAKAPAKPPGKKPTPAKPPGKSPTKPPQKAIIHKDDEGIPAKW